jgi:uncharacterized membrane protein
MIHRLKASGRLPLTLLLAGMSLFCFSLSVMRLVVTGSGQFLFLNWNLFLAFIPWLASTAATLQYRARVPRLALLALLAVWLLFFPNSPYILTDLFHLRVSHSAPIWFDLVLILSFAWTGLAYGLISLQDIEAILLKNLPRWVVPVVITLLLFISSFGVYIGRYLRWNSWDVVDDPYPLFRDIAVRVLDPMDHPRAWGLTLLLGVLLNMVFWTIKGIKHSRLEHA